MRVADAARLILICATLSACTLPASRAPVAERSAADSTRSTYRVRPGDTLYSIAWRHGIDFRQLASRNRIGKPYTIYPNQVLVLRDDRGAHGRGSASVSPRLGSLDAAPPPRRDFRWPGKGKVVRPYGDGNKGVDLQLPPGGVIGAVGDGEVVYAGGGLRGYESLIIVKHDARWLSAYSFNQRTRVNEGQIVKAGEPLADIKGEGSQALLHFEIRRDGDPVDPGEVISDR